MNKERFLCIQNESVAAYYGVYDNTNIPFEQYSWTWSKAKNFSYGQKNDEQECCNVMNPPCYDFLIALL